MLAVKISQESVTAESANAIPSHTTHGEWRITRNTRIQIAKKMRVGSIGGDSMALPQVTDVAKLHVQGGEGS